MCPHCAVSHRDHISVSVSPIVLSTVKSKLLAELVSVHEGFGTDLQLEGLGRGEVDYSNLDYWFNSNLMILL